MVVRTLPISTTNMTGLRTITRGSSFRMLSRIAARMSGPSHADTARTFFSAMA
jgi:hypothetical protein